METFVNYKHLSIKDASGIKNVGARGGLGRKSWLIKWRTENNLRANFERWGERSSDAFRGSRSNQPTCDLSTWFDVNGRSRGLYHF